MDDLKRTLLVVDDDEDIREILSDFASRDSYNVVVANDGMEALNILNSTKIDGVLTDLMMPNMNGGELIARTRAMGKMTPFVLISGVSDDTAILGAFRSGACDFIPKPFTPAIIRSVVNRVLDVGARISKMSALLDELAAASPEAAEKVDRIRRQQQQITRLLSYTSQ